MIKIKEVNKLSKDKKFILPLLEFNLFNKIFIQRCYYSMWRKWSITFTSLGKPYPKKTYNDIEVSEIRKKYNSKWEIPTNGNWRFWDNGVIIPFSKLEF